jgi:hypothetical protein
MSPGRKIHALALAVCAAVLLSACGGSDTTDNLHAKDESGYVDLGNLKYQVQLSRELNPYDTEDSSYLLGLTPVDARLTAQQAWFGVFMLAIDKHSQPYEAAHGFSVTDTQGLSYRPTPVTGDNPFAYHATMVQPHDQLPVKGSAGYNGPTGGLVLLFKVPLSAFDNRPLVLHITDPTNPRREATIDLDV